jgi:hypothetical protein
MSPLLDQAEEFMKLALQSDKRGLYLLAHTRYVQVWTTLLNIIMLRDTGVVGLSVKEEARLSAVYQLLSVRMHQLVGKIGNGRRLSGKIDDTPLMAVEIILEEVLAGF